MEKYNYRDAICEDIREYIKYHYDADVTIRCYLLNQCIHEVLDEIEEDIDDEEE